MLILVWGFPFSIEVKKCPLGVLSPGMSNNYGEICGRDY
jgi:hypothetical protein